jgi:peptidoglycan/LPS O-acetylase OafA/YrhL
VLVAYCDSIEMSDAPREKGSTLNMVVNAKRSANSRGGVLQKVCLVVAVVAGISVVVVGTFYDSPDSPAGKFVWAGVAVLLLVATIVYFADRSKIEPDDTVPRDPRFR